MERQVLEQDTIIGPDYRTGSVIPTGNSATKDTGGDSGLSEECFGLLCCLSEWLQGGIRQHSDTYRALHGYLRRHKLTDVEALTGKTGKLQQVRDQVSLFLPKTDDHVPEAVVARMTELVDYLLGWLGVECDHVWSEVASDDPKMSILRCTNEDCGLHAYSYQEAGKEPRWLAV